MCPVKAVYHSLVGSAEPFRGPSPIRTALERAGFEVVDFVDDRDAMNSTSAPGNTLSKYRGAADVWVTDWNGKRANDEVGPAVVGERKIPRIVVEPDRQIALREDEASARRLLDTATHVITTSSVTSQYIERLSPGNTTLLPAFIDAGPFLAAFKIRAEHRAGLSLSLRIPADSTWLLAHASSLTTESAASLQVLARAMSRLAIMDWRLIVIGDASQATRDALVSVPRDRLRFCERDSLRSLAALCAGCDMYLWPALDDATQGFVLEAQASGLAVVAGRNDVTQDQVLDGKTGRLTPADNPESFANAISFLLRHANFLQTFRENARELMRRDRGLAAGTAGIRNALTRLTGGGS